MSNICVIIGASGSGKSTIMKRLMECCHRYKPVTTYSTREMREGEENGKDYHFVTLERFEEMITNGQLLEYTKYAGNYYGIGIESIKDVIEEGKIPVIILDGNGLEALKNHYDNVTSFFIERDYEDMVESLKERPVSEEEKQQRYEQYDKDFATRDKCDNIIINKNIDESVSKILSIMFPP